MRRSLPPPLSRRQIAILAGQRPAVVTALTSARRGSGPHWLMVSALLDHLVAHGVDLQAAIAMAFDQETVKTAGELRTQSSPPLRDSCSARL